MHAEPLNVSGARATLLALRASLQGAGDISVPGVLLMPEGVPLSQEQAVQRIAAGRPTESRPVLCVGFTAMGCFAVGRWDLTGRYVELHQQFVRGDLEWLERELGNRKGARILLKGKERLILSLAELKAWYEAYQLPFVDRQIAIMGSPHSTSDVNATITFQPPIEGVRARRTES